MLIQTLIKLSDFFIGFRFYLIVQLIEWLFNTRVQQTLQLVCLSFKSACEEI
jgi:hypothetical protein